MSTTMRSRLAAIGLTLSLLFAGAIVGIGVDRLWIRDGASQRGARANRSPERQLERFRKRLDLSEEQARTIGAILRNTRHEVGALQDQSRAARERSRAAILAVLTPEQAATYRKMIDRAQRRRAKRGGRRRRQ